MILLLQTLTISLLLGLISQSYWFSYILFLIFIGGLLIIFIYIISLTFNNKFNFLKINIIKLTLNIIILIIIILLTIKYYNNIIIFNSNDILEINFNKSLFIESSINLIKLYNIPNIFITLLIINYLLFILRVVIKITNFKTGPLRNKIYVNK